MENNSAIEASVENRPGGAIDGGNITINGGGNIFLGNNTVEGTAITASVDRAGNGGNINITLPNGVLVAINEADIRANAVEGNGGRIEIAAFSILTTPDVDITATSDRGLDGTVELESLIDPEQFTFVTQQEYGNYEVSLRNACVRRNNNNRKTGSTLIEEEVLSRQDDISGRKYELKLHLSDKPLESKTLDDYRMNQANAVIHTPDGRVYLGKACLVEVD